MAISSIVVISVHGRLTSVLDPDRHLDDLGPLIHHRGSKILFDMGAVAAMDCSGIGLLVTLYGALATAGSVRFVHVRQRPRKMLEACGLLKVFETFECEEDALSSLVGPDLPELCLERWQLHVGSWLRDSREVKQTGSSRVSRLRGERFLPASRAPLASCGCNF